MNNHREASLVCHNEERAGSDSSFWQVWTGALVSVLSILVPSPGLTWGLSWGYGGQGPTHKASIWAAAYTPTHGRQLNTDGKHATKLARAKPHWCSLMDGFPMEVALASRWVKSIQTRSRLGWPGAWGWGQGVSIECGQRFSFERWKIFPDVVMVAQQCKCI